MNDSLFPLNGEPDQMSERMKADPAYDSSLKTFDSHAALGRLHGKLRGRQVGIVLESSLTGHELDHRR
jgi:hypothetical protein